MGSPVSPIVANLFVEWFEEQALATFRAELQLWKRYVDDTGVAIEEGFWRSSPRISTLFIQISSSHERKKMMRSACPCWTLKPSEVMMAVSHSLYTVSPPIGTNTSSLIATNPSNTNLELFAPSTIGRKSSVQPKRRK